MLGGPDRPPLAWRSDLAQDSGLIEDVPKSPTGTSL
jgi:hypothetical protein